ncbi:hypothetical protein GTY49_21130 [Streptomyces sp. SID5477]|nr:hypothetical protein [Streptomyces sp. SID5477]
MVEQGTQLAAPVDRETEAGPGTARHRPAPRNRSVAGLTVVSQAEP